MAANLTARKLRVFIGDDAQAWSFSAVNFSARRESVGESGIVKTLASIDLLDLLQNPESLDPRGNPARWREGVRVLVEAASDDGGWALVGELRLLKIPSGPSNGRLSLDLGCWLAWADDSQPEGDRTAVVTGAGENTATVATRLLVASGIPEAAIALGTWDYSLPYALPKEGNGSYLSQAGGMAWADHCRVICQDAAGVIRAEQWGVESLPEPIAAVTVGLNEAMFLPVPDPVPPAERVVVSGQGYQVVTTPERYSSSSFITEDANNFNENAFGEVVITTTKIFSWSAPTPEQPYYSTQEEVRVRQPQALVWVGTNSLQSTTEVSYTERRYDQDTKMLTRVESGEIVNVRAFVPQGAGAFGTTRRRRNVQAYTYNDAEVLVAISEVESVPRLALTGLNVGTGRFDLVTAKDVQTEWAEVRPDNWEKTVKPRQAAGQSPSNRAEDIKPTALCSEKPQVEPDSRPPATERWKEPTTTKEEHYSGECRWQHPGGAVGRDRVRPITIAPAYSNAQCFEIATREVQLLEGRRESHWIELPLSDALLWPAPLATVTVNDGSNLWTFRLDGVVCQFLEAEAKLIAAGICVGRVPLEVPVGVPLPAFVSGMDPGQVAPPEPPPFVPPADEVGDVVMGLSVPVPVLSATAEVVNARVRVALSVPVPVLSATAIGRGAATVALSVPVPVFSATAIGLGTAAIALVVPVPVLSATAIGEELLPEGGTITTDTIGGVNYRIHRFTSSGNFVNPSSRTVECLIVAGGGSGGRGRTAVAWGGGGGAGGLLEGSFSLASGTFPVVVGAGGALPTSGEVSGASGGNSTFNGATALGGGGGGGFNLAGGSGGSGGGGGGGTTSFAGGGSPTQGNSAGLAGYGTSGGSRSGGNALSGRGGGSGSAGGFNSAGGLGRSSAISGTSVTYATGGALNGGNAAANTGNGGGGVVDVESGNGGSGVVIVRYTI